MQKAEYTLREDELGVVKRNIKLVIDKFLAQPHGQGIFTEWIENSSSVSGFRGKESSFVISVKPYGKGFFEPRPEGETHVYLGFRSRADIKMRVEWKASITDPLGKSLQTSTVTSTVFEKTNGQYAKVAGMFDKYGESAVGILEDASFALHKDIKENGWLFDGALHVAVDIRFKVLEGGYCDAPASVDPFLTALRNQIDNPICPDFTLISADGEEIKVHKAILTLQSPVFRAMFENDSVEARTGICKIDNLNAKSIKAMLAYLHGVEPHEWSYESARDLYEFADKYKLNGLQIRSAVELSKRMTTKNLEEVLMLAYNHSEDALLKEAFIFLEDNFRQATLDGVWVDLTTKEVPEALVRQWQAHWLRRQEGVDMEDSD